MFYITRLELTIYKCIKICASYITVMLVNIGKFNVNMLYVYCTYTYHKFVYNCLLGNNKGFNIAEFWKTV